MTPLRRPVLWHRLLGGILHDLCVTVAGCALRTRHQLHGTRTVMLLMTGGTAVLDGIRLMESVGPLTQMGVAALAAVIDFFDSIEGCSLAKTVAHHLCEFSRGQSGPGQK